MTLGHDSSRIQTHPIAARESPDSQVRQCLGGCIGSLMWIGALDLKLFKLSKIGAPQTEPGKTSNVIIYEGLVMTLSQLRHDFKVFPSWWGLRWLFVQTCFPTCYLPMLWCCTGIRVELLAQIIQLHVCLARIWSGCLPVSQNLNLQSHSCATWA